jgi:hypothetical protein
VVPLPLLIKDNALDAAADAWTTVFGISFASTANMVVFGALVSQASFLILEHLPDFFDEVRKSV